MAATVFQTHREVALDTVSQIAEGLAPAMGSVTARALVGLAVDVEVVNSLLLPIVLGFLLLLEARALPLEHRMKGAYRWSVTAVCVVVMGFGLYMIPATIT